MVSKFLSYNFMAHLAIIVFTGFFFSKNAYPEVKITIDERPFLPVWCNHVQGFESDPRTIQFMNRVGKENWIHLHHYCYGLVQIFRSHRIGITLEQRQFHLGQAVNEINYVLKNASTRFVWRPELFTKRGLAFLLKQDYRNAENSFEDAIKENAKYWPPYGYLADLYLEQGKTDKARSILETGLKVAPNAQGLKNRMVKLEKNQ